MSAENVAVARRWFEEVWNQRRLEAVESLMAADSVGHLEVGDLQGPDAFRQQVYAPFVAALPDLHIDVEDVVAQGESAIVRWRAAGTHTGHGFGLAPTGRPIAIRGITWLRIRDGKIAEGWDCWNQGGFMAQLRGVTD